MVDIVLIKHFLEYTHFSRLVKIIIRILQPFLCFSFIMIHLFIFLINLLNLYLVTRYSLLSCSRPTLGP